MTKKPIRYPPEVMDLVHQDWTIELHPYPDGSYFAGVVELPGCMTEADSAAAAIDELDAARAAWIATELEEGREIPRPLGARRYSGKIFLRVSPHLHRRVVEMAARQGVSMSQWASELLAREVGAITAKDDLHRSAVSDAAAPGARAVRAHR